MPTSCQIDVWSVGCIFAEMLRRKPFFRGETPQHQLETIVSVIGLPSQDIMEQIPQEAIAKAIYSGAECKPYVIVILTIGTPPSKPNLPHT